MTLDERLARLKLLLLDVDGVMTDGKIRIDNGGVETKAFDVADGHGLKMLQRAGVDLGIYYRRRAGDKRCPTLRGRRLCRSADASDLDGNASAQPARQCPFDPRIRLYCPWHSPVCARPLQERVLAAERGQSVLDKPVRLACQAQLHGDVEVEKPGVRDPNSIGFGERAE